MQSLLKKMRNFVCRVCLSEKDFNEMTSIFDLDEENIEISSKLSDCSGLNIDKDDCLPNHICNDCLSKLIISFHFRKTCQKSDKTLRSSYQDSIKIEKPLVKEEINCDEDFIEIDQIKNEDSIELFSQAEEDDFSEISSNTPVKKFKSKKEATKNTKRRIIPKKNLVTEPEFYICEICGNFYNKRYQLRRHVEFHSDIKPFECEICKKRFRQNNHLARHMRSHTGQKPHQCRFCARCFSDLSTKIKHERSHTDERPYKCDTCGKAFRVADTRNKHMTIHTGEKAFSCDLCGSRFSRRDHLKTHFKSLIHKTKLNEVKINITKVL